MKRPRLALAVLPVLALAAWRTSAWTNDEGDPGPALGGGNRAIEPGPGPRSGALEGRGRSGALPARPDGAVTIAGTVVDAATHDGVGGVEVVFRGERGEESVIAGPDGRYRIAVAPGAYRAFVRDDAVLSIGRALVRLPGLPQADAASAPDEALMPLVVARADAGSVDLTVARGGVVHGRVVDRAGRPVAGAVLRARSGGPRPVLGTDVAESDADGAFELRLPPGGYDLEVSHARFAGIDGDEDERRLAVGSGELVERTFTLAAGCVVAGRVVAPGGGPAGEGAIEARWGDEDATFAPAGSIAADGTFRWTTTEEIAVALRAWPWKSPPSEARSFACRDGARFDGVVFELPRSGPDLDGVLVDSGGAPVPLAYIDVTPLDGGGGGQMERTDEQGRWGVYQLPPGQYLVTAHAPGRGVVAQAVTAPAAQVRLELSGAGRIAGRAPRIASGSFEVELSRCDTGETSLRLPGSARRLVAVTDHAFSIDDVPACGLDLVAIWRGRPVRAHVDVPAGGEGELTLAVGPPPTWLVRGTVTDPDGRPLAGARVQAYARGEPPATTETDGAGRYSLRAIAGAMLSARAERGEERYAGTARVPSDVGDGADADGADADGVDADGAVTLDVQTDLYGEWRSRSFHSHDQGDAENEDSEPPDSGDLDSEDGPAPDGEDGDEPPEATPGGPDSIDE